MPELDSIQVVFEFLLKHSLHDRLVLKEVKPNIKLLAG